MKNKIQKKGLITVFALSVLFTFLNLLSVAQTKNISSLTLANVEALNEDENHTGGMVECHGSGGLYCPANGKCAYNKVYVYQ